MKSATLLKIDLFIGDKLNIKTHGCVSCGPRSLGHAQTGVSIIIIIIESYSMVVLYIGINKVWGFLPKNPTKKSAKYLLSNSMAALVRHSQAQKCLKINSKHLY